MREIKDGSLYLVTSREYSGNKTTPEIVKAAASGGIDIIQMREKQENRDGLIRLGKELSRICRKSGIIFIVNDNPDIANEVNADGVHLGQDDIRKYPLAVTRKILGKDKLIGISTHSARQFDEANRNECDYIAFGPIFSTRTKDYSIGAAGIKKVLRTTKKPVIFIGGINLDNIDSVLSEGAKNIAVIRAITKAHNIAERVKALKGRINEYKNKW